MVYSVAFACLLLFVAESVISHVCQDL